MPEYNFHVGYQIHVQTSIVWNINFKDYITSGTLLWTLFQFFILFIMVALKGGGTHEKKPPHISNESLANISTWYYVWRNLESHLSGGRHWFQYNKNIVTKFVPPPPNKTQFLNRRYVPLINKSKRYIYIDRKTIWTSFLYYLSEINKNSEF